MSELHDAVVDWGLSQSPALETYDAAKRELIAGRTNSEVIDDAGGDMSWNEALTVLAAGGVTPSFLLLEIGDRLLMETGDALLL